MSEERGQLIAGDKAVEFVDFKDIKETPALDEAIEFLNTAYGEKIHLSTMINIFKAALIEVRDHIRQVK